MNPYSDICFQVQGLVEDYWNYAREGWAIPEYSLWYEFMTLAVWDL